MTTAAAIAWIAGFLCIAVPGLAVAALIVAANADDRDEHARRHMRERLGVGRGVGHHGQER